MDHRLISNAHDMALQGCNYTTEEGHAEGTRRSQSRKIRDGSFITLDKALAIMWDFPDFLL